MIRLIVTLLIIGVVIWLLETIPIIDATVKLVLRAVLIGVAVIYVVLFLLPILGDLLSKAGL